MWTLIARHHRRSDAEVPTAGESNREIQRLVTKSFVQLRLRVQTLHFMGYQPDSVGARHATIMATAIRSLNGHLKSQLPLGPPNSATSIYLP